MSAKSKSKSLILSKLALEERFNAIVMKGIEENPSSLNPQKKGTKKCKSKNEWFEC